MRVEIWGERTARNASEGAAWRFSAKTMALVGCLVGFGCLGAGGDGGDGTMDPAMQDATLRAARIEALRDAIERDHRMLEDLITQPGQAADATLHESPELREVATRLIEQEHELEALIGMAANEAAPSK